MDSTLLPPVLHPYPHFYWKLDAISSTTSLNFARYTNYQRKFVMCFPKLVCSEVSVINKNFLSNRSLLYCVISLSKNTLPSFTFKKFSHDKLPWSISKLHAKNRNKTRSIITGTHHNFTYCCTLVIWKSEVLASDIYSVSLAQGGASKCYQVFSLILTILVICSYLAWTYYRN